jgi:hypothetical protein
MKKLAIEWKHFEKEGETCERCAGTGENLATVVAELQQELKGEGVEVTLTETLLPASRIAESNMILFNGIPLENLLAEMDVAENPCASCACLTGEETLCRTVEFEGKTYEEIPKDLIRRAALKAVSSKID